jgi:hypothetical protein
MRSYETQSEGAGFGFLGFYLPEAAKPGRHRKLEINDPGIGALARCLSEERLARLLCPETTG